MAVIDYISWHVVEMQESIEDLTNLASVLGSAEKILE
jgi:hypothetical protein